MSSFFHCIPMSMFHLYHVRGGGGGIGPGATGGNGAGRGGGGGGGATGGAISTLCGPNGPNGNGGIVPRAGCIFDANTLPICPGSGAMCNAPKFCATYIPILFGREIKVLNKTIQIQIHDKTGNFTLGIVLDVASCGDDRGGPDDHDDGRGGRDDHCDGHGGDPVKISHFESTFLFTDGVNYSNFLRTLT